MKIVHSGFIRKLLFGFTYHTDKDLLRRLENVDPDDAAVITSVFEALIKPECDRFDRKSQSIVKNTLQYYLHISSVKDTDIDLFDALELADPVFGTPKDQRAFILLLWKVLYGEEDYAIADIEDYKISDSAYMVNSVRVRAGPKTEWPPKNY